MLPLFIDFFGFFLSYFLLMMVFNLIHQSQSHAFFHRILSAILSYAVVGFLLDYVINYIRVTVGFYSDTDMMKAVAWIFLSVITGLFIRAYMSRPEKLNIDEMKNFIRVALTFGNYFRLKDVDIREQIGTYKMKKIYEEVEGKPFSDEVIATAFDERVTTFKKVPVEELAKKKKHLPPEYRETIAQLKNHQTADISVPIRLELMDNTVHPFFSMIDRCVIDPVNQTFSMTIVIPMEKKVPRVTGAERTRLIEKLYEMVQIFIAFEWFPLYTPYILAIHVTMIQMTFSDAMTDEPIPIITFTIPYDVLLKRGEMITPASTIEKIADVRFLEIR